MTLFPNHWKCLITSTQDHNFLLHGCLTNHKVEVRKSGKNVLYDSSLQLTYF